MDCHCLIATLTSERPITLHWCQHYISMNWFSYHGHISFCFPSLGSVNLSWSLEQWTISCYWRALACPWGTARQRAYTRVLAWLRGWFRDLFRKRRKGRITHPGKTYIFSLSCSTCWSVCRVALILYSQFICVGSRKQSAYQANMESVKKQAVVDVVLKKLRDRLQMRGLPLHQCLMDTNRSSASVLDLRDFQKVWRSCQTVHV